MIQCLPVLTMVFFTFHTCGSVLAEGIMPGKIDTAQILQQAKNFAEKAGSEFQIETGELSDIYILREIAFLQAKSGDRSGAALLFNQLISRVLKLEQSSLFQKIMFLEQIALAQARSGFSEESRQTFRRAIDLSQGLRVDNASNDGRASTLHTIATAQLEAGDRAGGEKTLHQAIQGLDDLGLGALKIRLAIAFALRGIELGSSSGVDSTVKESLEKIDSIENARDRAIVIRDIAILQARAGDGQGAKKSFQKLLQTRKSFTDEWAKSVPSHNTIDALKIAESFFKSGRKDEGNEMINSAVALTVEYSDPILKSDIWWRIATLRAKEGDIQGAIKAASISDEEASDGWFPEEIVQAQIKAGDLESAYRSVARVRRHDDSIFGELAVAQAENGDIKGALKTMEAISNRYPVVRVSVLRAIAKAWVVTGKEKWGLEWAANQRSPIEKAYALLGVAEGLLHRTLESKIPCYSKGGKGHA